MTNRPTLGLVTAASRGAVNTILDGLGWGPGTFSIAMTDQPSPTHEATPTHYMMLYMGCPLADSQEIQALSEEREDLWIVVATGSMTEEERDVWKAQNEIAFGVTRIPDPPFVL